MSTELHTCPTCNHQATAYWHRLTPGLVGALIKLRTAVHEKQRNNIDIHKEMDLTTTEAMNWTKLRFHGLVAKYKVDGQVQRGQWVLTSRGAQFLRGEIARPRKVKTLNNAVVDHDYDDLVKIKDLGHEPFFEGFHTIERESQPLELTQAGLF